MNIKITTIEDTLKALFQGREMFKGRSNLYPAQPAELKKLGFVSATVWRILLTDIEVFVGKNRLGNNEVAIWMPVYNRQVLLEIIQALAGLHCQVSLRSCAGSRSVFPEIVKANDSPKLIEQLSSLFFMQVPEC